MIRILLLAAKADVLLQTHATVSKMTDCASILAKKITFAAAISVDLTGVASVLQKKNHALVAIFVAAVWNVKVANA